MSIIDLFHSSIYSSHDTNEHSKEDVWSIACIIVEMMIHTILFRPQNDDPTLQLLCIVQYVGGLSATLLDHFPLHVKRLFSKIKCDPYQLRLHRLLQHIFSQYKTIHHDHSIQNKENLFDLLKQMFHFQSVKRLTLCALLDHPFFSLYSSKTVRLRTPMSSSRLSLTTKNTSNKIDHLVHLCIKLNLEHSRWDLTLKERCLFELILHMDRFSQINLSQYGLSQSLQSDIQKLLAFLTGF
jgi:serine/threonine protein kinase